MLLSVVIPAFNEEKLLGACLASVKTAFAAQVPAVDHELIVCDNASKDSTAAIAAAAGVRTVFEPHNNIACARNTGAMAASGDWLLFIDADSTLKPELLAATLAIIIGGRAAGGTALVRFEPRPPWWGVLPEAVWNLISRIFKLACGSYLFCRADLFRQAGCFDARLYAGEELSLSRALKSLARPRALSFEVITSMGHVSSSRKFSLYSFWRLIGFAFHLVRAPFSSVRSKRRLEIFYDGKTNR